MLKGLLFIVICAAIFGWLTNSKEPDKGRQPAVAPAAAPKTKPAVKTAAEADGGRQKLLAAMSRFKVSPCTSELQLKNLWALGGWVLTCEGCAAAPADRIFNKAMLQLADDMSVKGKPLYVRDMYQAAGQC